MNVASPPGALVRSVRRRIIEGEDPLGTWFQMVRKPAARRATGAVYTPAPMVRSMLGWVASQGLPSRIVDPGAGSGRFILEAAKAFPKAELIAIEPDVLAALMLKANAAALGMGERIRIEACDYRELRLPEVAGATVFIGNPPYVRHHAIDPAWKTWYQSACKTYGVQASALAGLHLHFFVRTLQLASPGDFGMFITAAEWLDVNYGSALRALLTGPLGAVDLQVLDASIEAFPGTASTAAITGFKVGERAAPVRVRAVVSPEEFNKPGGRDVLREDLRSAGRWSFIIRGRSESAPGTIELGEIFRVHRGQVTGANKVWVRGSHVPDLPERLMVPTVTKARDLIDAGEELTSAAQLRRVIELPADLAEVPEHEYDAVQRFLRWAKARGAHEGYVATHRRAWWSVGLRAAAPILCTYMARRPPQFTLNTCSARHINVAHGLYPRGPLEAGTLRGLTRWLNSHADGRSGRSYAGGLMKFEPKEIERLRIPDPSSFAT